VQRPFQVTVLGWLFIVVGFVSTIGHLVKGSFDRWVLPILLVGIVAVVAGAFLLRSAGWARWLALAWLTFHVAAVGLISLWDALAHAVLLLVVGYFLLGPLTAKYFQGTQAE
jgi:hypothetical protein